ncbi:hypothetical protein C8J57DRAFT_1654571 [Mycena rebaudengoi]|nr:hypothetical protein C8J57DRAFT_1654571 [Mycena rebaudengoi]
MQTANCAQSISENGTWAEMANYWCFDTISSLLIATGLHRGLPHFSILRGVFDQLQYALYQYEQYDAAESWSMFWHDPTVSAWNGKPLNHFFDSGVGVDAQLLDRQQHTVHRGQGRHEPGPPDAPCLGRGRLCLERNSLRITGKHIIFHIDVFDTFTTFFIRSPPTLLLLRHFPALSCRFDFTFASTWLSSKEDAIADTASRFAYRHMFQLAPYLNQHPSPKRLRLVPVASPTCAPAPRPLHITFGMYCRPQHAAAQQASRPLRAEAQPFSPHCPVPRSTHRIIPLTSTPPFYDHPPSSCLRATVHSFSPSSHSTASQVRPHHTSHDLHLSIMHSKLLHKQLPTI